jgi:hypothetical protein
VKNIINHLLLITFVFTTQQTSAQTKEINSNKDLPLLTFSTETLQPDNPASVEAWMKNVAVVELPHIDSILSNYKISDIRLHLYLILGKQSCNFISGNRKL